MKEDDKASSIIAANITDASSNDSISSGNNHNNYNSYNARSSIQYDKQMIGGCCVCADDSGYCDNPLVYCDGSGCNVAVHQACYGIVTVPEGPWFCKRCELNDKNCFCVLCPSKEGAMKRTETGGWAHVICALYIPEITFTNVRTMEPIVISNIRSERYNKKCYICETNKRENSDNGVCVNCSKTGCKLWFHVTCAQTNGLLCEDHSLPGNNVKYCIYCKNHHSKLNSEYIKRVPPFKMITNSNNKVNKEKSKITKHEHTSSISSTSSSSSTKSSNKNNNDNINNTKFLKGRIKTLLGDSNNSNCNNNNNNNNNNNINNNSEKKSSKKLKTTNENSNKEKTNNSNNILSSSSPSSSSSTLSLNKLKNENINNNNNNNNNKFNDLYDDDSIPEQQQTIQSEIKTVNNYENISNNNNNNNNVNDSVVVTTTKLVNDVHKEQTIVQKLDENKQNESIVKQETVDQMTPIPETLPKPSSSSSITTIINQQSPSNTNITTSTSTTTTIPTTTTTTSTNNNKLTITNKTINNLADSKINLLLKSSENEIKINLEPPQQQVQKQQQTFIVDKNKEIAAHLLADLSLNKIENNNNNNNDHASLTLVSLPQIKLEIDVKPPALSQINELLISKTKISPPITTTTTTTTTATTITTTTTATNNQTTKIKTKKNISSLLESPIKSTKISAMVSSTAVNPTSLISPVSSEITNDDEKKPKKTKTKRKSNDLNDLSTKQTSAASTSANTSPTTKKRKKQLVSNTEENLSLDIFGNRLNSLSCLPAGCTTNDFEMVNEEEQQKQQQQQQQQPKTSTISSLLNNNNTNKINKMPLIGPPKPIIQSKYTILEEEPINDIQNQFPETLEDLLLKRWQLDSEFLMEQSQNFDIASLLNCLYQLKNENKDLETKAIELSKRRDQLLLINTRLTLPLEIRANESINNENVTNTNSSTTTTNATTATTTITINNNNNNNNNNINKQPITPKLVVTTNDTSNSVPPTLSPTVTSFNLNNDDKSLINNQPYIFTNTNVKSLPTASNSTCNSPSSTTSSKTKASSNDTLINTTPTKTPKPHKLTKKQLQLQQQQQQQQPNQLTLLNQQQQQQPNQSQNQFTNSTHTLKINEYLANVNKTQLPFTNEIYSQQQQLQQQQQQHQQQQQQQQQQSVIQTNLYNNQLPVVQQIQNQVANMPNLDNNKITVTTSSLPTMSNQVLTSTVSLLSQSLNTNNQQTKLLEQAKYMPTNPSKQNVSTPPITINNNNNNNNNIQSNRSTPTPLFDNQSLNQAPLNIPSGLLPPNIQHRLSPLFNDPNFKAIAATNPQLAAGFYLEFNKNSLTNSELENRKLDKINQLSLSSSNPSQNLIQQQQQQQPLIPPNIFSTTNPNELLQALNKSSLSTLMLKQTQSQAQNFNQFYQQQNQQQQNLSNSTSNLYRQDLLIPSTIGNTLTSNNNNNNNNNRLTSSSSPSITPSIASGAPPTTSSSSLASLVSTPVTSTTTTTPTNEILYHSQNQNIILPLNHGLQNLFQNIDPATANTILNQLGSQLGTTIVPHIDLLSLIPNFTSQQLQQQQQQQQTQSQQFSNSSTATNDTG